MTTVVTQTQIAAHEGVVSRFEVGECPQAESREGELRAGLTAVVCTYRRPASLRRFLDSLAGQDRKPEMLLVVDAGPDAATEETVRAYPGVEALAECVLYFRVSGPLKGLTRQRNFALRWVTTDLVAFFDDDVVLLDGCLREMERAYRRDEPEVSGVGAYIESPSEGRTMGRAWHLRRLLRVVPNLRPGTYTRSGVSIPWTFLPETRSLVEGDWLAGCAMMWPTQAAREVGFNDKYRGYSSGEDLEFSLKMRERGKLLVNGGARILHLEESQGRPDPYRLGYMYAHNNYYIHRDLLPGRTWRDGVRFFYAWGIDSLIEALNLALPGRRKWTWTYLRGRAAFFARLLLKRSTSEREQ